ncbi:hypothetical protein TRV_02850 [Trichophyton verrucosum HKI 0517]|uniref:Uncharacterized protein n=1 Tax=Trichophyton verrucosum (strain HKI 0517) TaxID=663202 RepID=D4D6X3_TRIVH|nr:uncharacterized protein TRV_02850 [Trichophyton verrucosum HKI 0517]EFE42411.1 hypothetical protein TRV_02850 [Trichophyton verrucosum HKI 0517]
MAYYEEKKRKRKQNISYQIHMMKEKKDMTAQVQRGQQKKHNKRNRREKKKKKASPLFSSILHAFPPLAVPDGNNEKMEKRKCVVKKGGEGGSGISTETTRVSDKA